MGFTTPSEFKTLTELADMTEKEAYNKLKTCSPSQGGYVTTTDSEVLQSVPIKTRKIGRFNTKIKEFHKRHYSKFVISTLKYFKVVLNYF